MMTIIIVIIFQSKEAYPSFIILEISLPQNSLFILR